MFDGGQARTGARFADQLQEFLRVAVDDAGVQPQGAAAVKADTVSFGCTGHIRQHVTESVAQLPKAMGRILRFVVSRPQRLHRVVARNTLRWLASQVQQEFPGLHFAAWRTWPDL